MKNPETKFDPNVLLDPEYKAEVEGVGGESQEAEPTQAVEAAEKVVTNTAQERKGIFSSIRERMGKLFGSSKTTETTKAESQLQNLDAQAQQVEKSTVDKLKGLLVKTESEKSEAADAKIAKGLFTDLFLGHGGQNEGLLVRTNFTSAEQGKRIAAEGIASYLAKNKTEITPGALAKLTEWAKGRDFDYMPDMNELHGVLDVRSELKSTADTEAKKIKTDKEAQAVEKKTDAEAKKEAEEFWSAHKDIIADAIAMTLDGSNSVGKDGKEFKDLNDEINFLSDEVSKSLLDTFSKIKDEKYKAETLTKRKAEVREILVKKLEKDQDVAGKLGLKGDEVDKSGRMSKAREALEAIVGKVETKQEREAKKAELKAEKVRAQQAEVASKEAAKKAEAEAKVQQQKVENQRANEALVDQTFQQIDQIYQTVVASRGGAPLKSIRKIMATEIAKLDANYVAVPKEVAKKMVEKYQTKKLSKRDVESMLPSEQEIAAAKIGLAQAENSDRTQKAAEAKQAQAAAEEAKKAVVSESKVLSDALASGRAGIKDKNDKAAAAAVEATKGEEGIDTKTWETKAEAKATAARAEQRRKDRLEYEKTEKKFKQIIAQMEGADTRLIGREGVDTRAHDKLTRVARAKILLNNGIGSPETIPQLLIINLGKKIKTSDLPTAEDFADAMGELHGSADREDVVRTEKAAADKVRQDEINRKAEAKKALEDAKTEAAKIAKEQVKKDADAKIKKADELAAGKKVAAELAAEEAKSKEDKKAMYAASDKLRAEEKRAKVEAQKKIDGLVSAVKMAKNDVPQREGSNEGRNYAAEAKIRMAKALINKGIKSAGEIGPELRAALVKELNDQPPTESDFAVAGKEQADYDQMMTSRRAETAAQENAKKENKEAKQRFDSLLASVAKAEKDVPEREGGNEGRDLAKEARLRIAEALIKSGIKSNSEIIPELKTAILASLKKGEMPEDADFAAAQTKVASYEQMMRDRIATTAATEAAKKANAKPGVFGRVGRFFGFGIKEQPTAETAPKAGQKKGEAEGKNEKAA